jgi:hypothetical protein
VSWLLRDGDVLAALDGRRGLCGPIEGARVVRAPLMPHTLRSGLAVDLAWCGVKVTDGGEACFEVRRIATLAPRRVGRPLSKGVVIAAEAGAFERWHLQVGDRLEIRDT